jgi:hypothetical protein
MGAHRMVRAHGTRMPGYHFHRLTDRCGQRLTPAATRTKGGQPAKPLTGVSLPLTANTTARLRPARPELAILRGATREN